MTKTIVLKVIRLCQRFSIYSNEFHSFCSVMIWAYCYKTIWSFSLYINVIYILFTLNVSYKFFWWFILVWGRHQSFESSVSKEQWVTRVRLFGMAAEVSQTSVKTPRRVGLLRNPFYHESINKLVCSNVNVLGKRQNFPKNTSAIDVNSLNCIFHDIGY